MAEPEKDFKMKGERAAKPAPQPQGSFRPGGEKAPEQKQRAAGYKHLVRIAQVDLPGEKPIKVALTHIKGVGFNLASAACNAAGIPQGKITGELSEEEAKKLDRMLINPKEAGFPSWMFNRRKDYESGEDKHLLMGTLDFVKDNTIKTLKKIKCYRGVRHIQGQPVRGQRTRSHFRQHKGKVVGVVKKKEAPKTAEGGGKKKAKK